MAKWGEGDPRWIVEDRPDATNVNNWHWTEKDASGWSRDKLEGLLVGLKFDGNEGSCEVSKLSSTSGEASANNRKGKLILFYEWAIELKWSGKVKDSDKKVKGTISIPNLSEENEIEEVDVSVSVDEDSAASRQLKAMLHRVAPSLIRQQLQQYLMSMRQEFCQSMLLPSKSDSSTTGTPTSRSRSPAAPPTRQTSLPGSKSPSSGNIGYKIHTKKVALTDTFMTSVEELYDTFITEQLVEAFTRSKAVINAHKGGSFSILDGKVTGEFVELERPTKIVQRWRSSSWPAGHYSTVTLTLEQEPSGAKLVLAQLGVPEADYDRTKEGWRRHILESIKSTFGYGAQLF